MKKIFLVRHGQDEDNRDGILNGRRDQNLTDLGKKQVSFTAQKLLDKDIKYIYTSPLKRAKQTADIISNVLNLKPITEELLTERELGILTGKPVTEIKQYAKKILVIRGITYFFDAENSETYPELYERAKLVLEKIKEKHKTGNILLVVHGDIGKMIRAVYYDLSWKEGLVQLDFKNADILVLE